MMYSPTVALLIFDDLWSTAMQLTLIFCEDLVTTVHHIWENLDEKDIPRVFSRTEVNILLDHL